ncbi:ABA4-like family protein [Pelagibacteraceae bacterium]|jgi:hypothetical protein|nr:ABA4-like family protein [Pelagibacteraceae bacterium]
METIKDFFTLETIYLVSNYSVIPLWLMLLVAPNSKFTNIIINTIALPTILAFTYGYLLYQQFYNGGMFAEEATNIALNNFSLYLGIDQLSSLMTSKTFLLTFWIHFLTISIFAGTWIAKDAFRNGIHKYVTALPLILTYFTGPLGLFFYLFIRLVIIQKVRIHD